jgi:hypothetical protein
LGITANAEGDTVQVDHSGSDFIVRDGSHELRVQDTLVDQISVVLMADHQTVNIETTLAHKGFGVYAYHLAETINVSPTARNLNTIQGGISIVTGYDEVEPPPGSYDLEMFDQADTVNTTYTIYPSYMTRSGWANSIRWDGGANVRLDCGRGANTCNINPGFSQCHVTCDTTSGAAAQEVYVPATTAPVDIIGGSRTYVRVGEPGITMQSIRGPVHVSGHDTVLGLNDLTDNTPRTVTMSATMSGGSVTGLAPAPITYTADLNRVVVLGGSGGNTFTVSDTPIWTILNSGDGNDTISVLGTSSQLDILASGGDDRIKMFPGTFLGPVTIDGGVGYNTLDYTAFTTSNVLVNLVTGTATDNVVSINGIQQVLGGIGGPPGTYNILVGNGGNRLVGGNGRRNILVAGGFASTLIGGNQDDLLIAGYTTYDADPADPAMVAWQQIAAEWASSDDFATRTAKLGSGSGVPVLDATTVFGNFGGNVVTCMGETAWIFSDGFDFVTGFGPGSRTDWISQ